MKTIHTILAASLLGLGLTQAEKTSTPVVQGLNPDFSPALYQQLSMKEGNVFFSPYSITEAMAMVHAGAGGNTAVEITKAMAWGDSGADDLAGRSEALRRHLAKGNQGENKLSVANALCITGIPPKPDYQNLIHTRYDGELFTGGLDEINGWVKKKTEGKIEKILENLSNDTACVLLNAVYFKGNWKTCFNKVATSKAKFHRKPGDPVEVDMMYRGSACQVLQDMGLIAVELPYENGTSMVLIMPDKAEGMAELEKRVSGSFLKEISTKLTKSGSMQINLFVPKFKVSTEYDLIPAMKALGVKDAFANADFTPMLGSSGFNISQIKHKATLEVEEKGTVASAATAVEIQKESARIMPDPEIRFDRPFLVLIRDQASETILFMGRINDPGATSH